MSDHGAFLRKAIDVLGLFRQIGEGNEQRKIGVFMASRFEHSVQSVLDIFPKPVAPRFNHHAATHIGGLSKFSSTNDLLVPLGKVGGAGGGDGGSGLAHAGWRGMYGKTLITLLVFRRKREC